MQKQYHIIGACSGWGAQIRACERGPEDLIEGKVFDRLMEKGIPIKKIEMVYPQKMAREEVIPLSASLPLILEFNHRLAATVQRSLSEGAFPIVLGGDHANALGTWNGIGGPLGLLWIDAHMDAHTPETTPSGAYHGMPLAALLGHGNPEMTHLLRTASVLKPQNIALVGVRSFEKREEELLKRLNVRIYFMSEIQKRGLKSVLIEAMAHVLQGVTHFGVSLDLDAFDPQEAPGVGSPEKEGIKLKDFLPLLSLFRQEQRFCAFELVEFNPQRDVNHKTRELVFQVLYELMKS